MNTRHRPHFSSPALAGEARERSESGGGKSAAPDESYELRQREKQSKPFARQLRKQMTDAELILWSALRRKQMHGFRFRRQHPLGPYIADFACISLKLIVEVDGATHATPAELAYDKRRREYFASRGWREIRVGNDDVYNHLEAVIDRIWRECTALANLRKRGPADV